MSPCLRMASAPPALHVLDAANVSWDITQTTKTWQMKTPNKTACQSFTELAMRASQKDPLPMILVILLILLMMRNQTRSRRRRKRRRRDRNLQRMNLSESLSSPCQLLKNRLSQRDRLILRESNANKTKRKSLNKIRNLSQSLRRSPKMILRNKNFAQLVSNMLRKICIMVMVKLLPADCQ